MRVASLVLLVCVATGVAAPVPKKPATDYFPCALGAEWQYAREGEKGVAMWVDVTKVEEKDGVRTVEMRTTTKTKGGQSVRVTVFRIDGDGVSKVKDVDKTFDPPLLALRAKPVPEDKWEAKLLWGTARNNFEMTVGKEEEVKVAAGSFSCLPHLLNGDMGDVRYEKIITWYAPGVGPVKIREGDWEFTLLKYTAGKDK